MFRYASRRARARLALTMLALSLCVSPVQAQRGFDASDAGLGRSAIGEVGRSAQDLAIYALGLVGVDYRYGGESPAAGLDCSGLVRHVFQHVTGVALPRTSTEMSRIGVPIARVDLAVGDLLFFNTRRHAYSHVGIYLGDDRFIHAPSRGGEVGVAELSNDYWRKHFNGARRLVGVVPGMIVEAEAATRGAPASLAAR